MKILHINSYYGAGKFFKNLCKSQVSKNIDIDVFLPTPKNFDNNFDYGSYTTISVNHGKYDRYIFHLKHLKILKDVKKQYNINDFDLIHAHSLFSNGYIAKKLSKEYKLPYVVTVRSSDVDPFFKKALHLRRLGISILENASAVTFLSKTYQDLVISKYVPKSLQKSILAKSTVIPNGIDSFWLENINQPKKITLEKDLSLIQVGDINENKNVLTTIQAVKTLETFGYKVKLLLVGKIKDKNIYDQIKDLNNVVYLGYLSKKDLVKSYRKSDIFVLPSLRETFGLVYAEAMSQGLPLIYSKGQGFDQQFKDGVVGYPVISKDPQDIAKKIIEITNNYSEISTNCTREVYKFDWDQVSDQYLKTYKTVLKERDF